MDDRALVSPEDEAFLAIAVAIADGTPVQWTAYTPSGSLSSHPDAASLALRLRALERIVRGHGAVIASVEPVSFESQSTGETFLTEARRKGQASAEEILRVQWGPLIVLDKIGHGSFGDVYRAWDPRLEREVALKLVNATSSAVTTPTFEEGRLLARVRHPNVVAVYGAERVNNRVGIWMEYIRGRTVAEEIAQQGPVSPEEAARIGAEVCRALSAVHGAGLLHRDVKAQNVMRDHDGRIVLGDFGTGLVFDENESLAEPQIAGTPLYLAPEILRGQRPSAATDVYSVGVLLYFLVTGQYPTCGRSLKELRRAHKAGNTVPLRQAKPDLPRGFLDIVDALIEPGPDRRYGNAGAAEVALTSWLASTDGSVARPMPARTIYKRPMVVAAALLSTAVVVAALTPSVRSRFDSWRRGAFAAAGGSISRQITNAPCSGAPSADGRWMACVESPVDFRARGANGPRLMLFAPDSGETRILKEPGAGVRISAAHISPDGNSVVFVLVAPQRPPEVRAITADRQNERLILAMPDDVRMMSLNSWSDHDQRIAARIWRKDNSQAVALLTPATGALEVALELEDVPQGLHRSPDGRYLAMDVLQAEDAPERDIRVCDLSSRTCETPVSHPANDVSPHWTPDGRLFFVSDRAGTMGLWAVDLQGMRPSASPVLIRDTGRSVLGAAGFGGGIFFYSLRVNDFDVYSAPLSGSPTAVSPIVRLSPRAVDVNRSPVWSPDGESVAYVSRRGPFQDPGGMRIVIQTLRDGRERGFRYELPPNMNRLAWAPDSKRLALRSIKGGKLPGGNFGIHIVDAETGTFLQSLRRRDPPETQVEEQIMDLRWLDDDTIVFASKGGLGVFDISSGEERMVWTAPQNAAVASMSTSPDSRWAAVSWRDGEKKQWVAALISLAGADPRELLRVNSPELLWIHDWTRDGRCVLATRWDSAKPYTSERRQLWSVPADGSSPSPLPLALPGLDEVRVHPDGRRLAFSAGGSSNEFWMLSGLTK